MKALKALPESLSQKILINGFLKAGLLSHWGSTYFQVEKNLWKFSTYLKILSYTQTLRVKRMFSMDIKRAGATLLIAVPTCLIAGEYNNSNPFSAEDLEREPTLIAGSDHVPDSGDNGKPAIRITVGGSRGSGEKAELSIYIPSNFMFSTTAPKFLWELSKPVNTAVRFLISTPEQTEPIVNKIISGPLAATLHTTSPGPLPSSLEYQWMMYICKTKACSSMASDLARVRFQISN